MPVSTSVQSKAPVALPANAEKSQKVASGPVDALNKLDSGVDKIADKV